MDWTKKGGLGLLGGINCGRVNDVGKLMKDKGHFSKWFCCYCCLFSVKTHLGADSPSSSCKTSQSRDFWQSSFL